MKILQVTIVDELQSNHEFDTIITFLMPWKSSKSRRTIMKFDSPLHFQLSKECSANLHNSSPSLVLLCIVCVQTSLFC